MKPEQWVYVRARIAGKSPQAAFDEAKPGASPHMRKKTPYMWERNKEVRHQLQLTEARQKRELKPEVKALLADVKEAGMNRQRKREILKAIANDSRKSPMARIAAIKVDNEMTGDNAPVRIEGEITLHTIFNSLGGTTGLPSPHEVIEIQTVTP
jgi:hypothetical protein